jgi:hypothetical protein
MQLIFKTRTGPMMQDDLEQAASENSPPSLGGKAMFE